MKNNTETNEVGVILHGECMVFPSSLPADASPINLKEDKYMIVAPSETTGNHHVVDLKPGVTFYEANGVKFMVNEVPTQIRCVIQERHDEIKLPAGTWEFGSQQEFDPFTARMQAVRD